MLNTRSDINEKNANVPIDLVFVRGFYLPTTSILEPFSVVENLPTMIRLYFGLVACGAGIDVKVKDLSIVTMRRAIQDRTPRRSI